MHNPLSLRDKTILITGASDGIGRETAVECSRLGAKVIISGRSEKKLKETLSCLCNKGHFYSVADLTDADQLNTLIDRSDSIDGIVHCAGVARGRLVKDITPEDLRLHFSINFDAPMLLTANLLLKNKINSRGSIVFLASLSPLIGTIGLSLYSSTKAALIAASKCLALEVANKQIRVNCIAPGQVDTEMLNSLGSLQQFQRVHYPFGIGKKIDVTNAIVFFLSDNSQKVTGNNFVMHGGYAKHHS